MVNNPPSFWQRALAAVGSLKLTVALMVLALLLVFVGTLAQVDSGIYQVQKDYFHSLFVKAHLRLEGGTLRIPVFPGGYVLGGLMILNLAAAAARRFDMGWRDLLLVPAVGLSLLLAWALPSRGGVFQLTGAMVLWSLPPLLAAWWAHGRKAGMMLIHLGLLILLMGEGTTSLMQYETHMVLDEGTTAHYSESPREFELAVIDPSNPAHDEVVAVSGRRLARGGVIVDSRLPFDITIEKHIADAELLSRQDTDPPTAATAGIGTQIIARQRTGPPGKDERPFPAAYLNLRAQGQNLGTYLLAAHPFPIVQQPQAVTVQNRTWLLQLRPMRHYKPYSLHLIKFSHDRYLGTDTPSNFSSRIHLVDPQRGENRDVLIKMNEPLRHRQEAYYQLTPRPGDKGIVLQVVRNPSWTVPYIACVIGGLGLTVHFLLRLRTFLERRQGRAVEDAAAALDEPRRPILAPVLLTLVGLGVVAAIWVSTTARPQTAYDLTGLGQVPVVYEGRVQPLDTLARNLLKILSGRESLRIDGRRVAPIEALADIIARPQKAMDYPLFRIDDRQVIGLLGLDFDSKRFSAQQIEPRLTELQEHYQRAARTESRQRDAFQNAVLSLGERWNLYMQLSRDVGSLYFVPPLAGGDQWQQLGPATESARKSGTPEPAIGMLLQLYASQRPDDFNRVLEAYRGAIDHKLSKPAGKAAFETWFNYLDPLQWCMSLYVLGFVLVCVSWLRWRQSLGRGAMGLVLLGLAIHTLALAGRIYISGRPPVTNLASSAIFIAWGAVALAVIIEPFLRSGLGTMAAALAGFTSLLIGDRLALSGDTMKVLVAVLDTNFWLATHVITITLGYSAAFLAGLLGIAWIFRGLFSSSFRSAEADALGRMIYGVSCFAILLSFVGTVLGGIWADQSWGRFWGWDPKENGALMIVLWLAAVIHARWNHLVGWRGLAVMAVIGNIITSWSWFGTNMLGVGLHSYGFMDSALLWLLAFIASQLVVVTLGLLPVARWAELELQAPPPEAQRV